MTPTDAKRRLVWHGILIFLLGLLAGAFVPWLKNPRMGVAAHVGGVLSGIFLVLVGLIWREIKLASRVLEGCLLALSVCIAHWVGGAVFGGLFWHGPQHARWRRRIQRHGLAGSVGGFRRHLFLRGDRRCRHPGIIGATKECDEIFLASSYFWQFSLPDCLLPSNHELKNTATSRNFWGLRTIPAGHERG